MKTITQAVIFGALALWTAMPASRAVDQQPAASEETPPRLEQRRAERMKQMDEKLQLTPEQKSRIEAIWKEAGEEAKEQRQSEQRALRERRKQMRETRKEVRAQVRAVLTPEQQKIFDEMPRGSWHGPKARKQQSNSSAVTQ